MGGIPLRLLEAFEFSVCGRNTIILLTYTLYFGLGCYDSGENSTPPPILFFSKLKKLTDGYSRGRRGYKHGNLS